MNDNVSVEGWVEKLCHELGIRADEFDIVAVLDLARDAAHHVERRAAPLTTFIAGYAAGARGGGRAEIDAQLKAASAFSLANRPDGPS